MNFFEMRREFDRICRTLGDSTFTDYRDDYLNYSGSRIGEMFVVPSLKKKVYIDSVSGQATYQFPLDYGGTEVYLWYKEASGGTSRRIDPVTEEVLALMYERRSGNMGPVWYYDWTAPVGTDYAVRACTVTANSTTVACVTAAAADVDRWIRFDPWTTGTTTYNPGDYGYHITAVTVGVSYTLDRTYRGPSGATNGRVQPAEQQQFVCYGTPASSLADSFTLEYYSKPKRLYNDADVPEWPDTSMGQVFLAVAIGYDYLHLSDQSKIWFGRAMSTISNLQRRREHNAILVSDLSIGSVSGRKTGARSIDLSRKFSYGQSFR